MRITLIQPRVGPSLAKGSMPPLAMGILARYTPPEYRLNFIDESVEEVPEDLNTDLIAMSVTTLTAKRAYDLADHFRSRGIKVVMGGIHPTVMPEEALQHADTVVKGIGEHIWPEVLADAAAGRLKKEYTGSNDQPLQDLIPDRSIYAGKKYAPVVPVQFGRGCQFACDFCSVHAVYGRKVKHRPVDEMLEEIASIKTKVLFMVDDNIQSYGTGTFELLRGLKKLKKKWFGQISVNAAHNLELVKLLAASGCIGLIIGFESVDEQNLLQMGKKVNIKHDYIRAINNLQRHGIMVTGSFVFGYDYDNETTVRKAFDFAESHHFVHAYFNPLVPTPSTGLYDRIKAEERFTEPIWWLSDSFRYGSLPFTPKGTTAAKLEKACITARRDFDSYLSMFKRGFGSKANFFSFTNLFIFWLANIVYRREYRRKYNHKIFD